MLAPPLAALVNIGVVEIWHVREPHPWIAMALLLVGAGATFWIQYTTATLYLE